MLELTVEEILQATSGLLVHGPNKQTVRQISIDSRKIQAGDLFIALKGENFNGADFIEEALDKGACGYIAQRSEVERRGLSPVQSNGDSPQLVIEVDDSLKALQGVAAYLLKKVNPKVVAITGSTGKTSVKDMLRSILAQKYKVLASEGNYNNEVGLPLTLLNLESDTEIIILEMAMRGLGQIAQLCEIASPDYAVITNIGHSHIEKLQSQENIIKAKSEIIQGLKKGGTIFLNSDDASTEELKRLCSLSRARQVNEIATLLNAPRNDRRGDLKPHNDVIANLLSTLRDTPLKKGCPQSNNLAWQSHNMVFFGTSGAGVAYKIESYDKLARPSFTLSTINHQPSTIIINLSVPGAHFVSDAAAAAAVALQLEMTLSEIKEGLEGMVLSPGRMQIYQANSFTILNDVYNASPESMKAALDVLKEIKATRKVAVLGDMRELGGISDDEHFKLGRAIAQLGVAALLTVGVSAKNIAKGALAGGIPAKQIKSFADVSELNKEIINHLTPGDAILIKASRAIELEKTVQYLQKKR